MCNVCSVLQSFEVIVSQYAQQLTTNERQSFSAPSLVVIAELVSETRMARVILIKTIHLFCTEKHS